MVLLLLEALLALCLFLFIVWWTMFSGRKKGELPSDLTEQAAEHTTGAAAEKAPALPAELPPGPPRA